MPSKETYFLQNGVLLSLDSASWNFSEKCEEIVRNWLYNFGNILVSKALKTVLFSLWKVKNSFVNNSEV